MAANIEIRKINGVMNGHAANKLQQANDLLMVA